jgi:hypothetical protein
LILSREANAKGGRADRRLSGILGTVMSERILIKLDR